VSITQQSRKRLISAATTAIIGFVLGACQSGPSAAPPVKTASTLASASAPADAVYASLPGFKAQALSLEFDDQSVRYTNNAANQQSPVAAALQALRDCEKARAARTSESLPCEIRRKGDLIIHSTAELTTGLGADRDALLWRLRAKNTASGSGNVYIAGSIHVLKPSLQAPPSYSLALRATDALVFEIDEAKLSAKELQELVARYGSLPEGQTLTDLLTPSDYQRLVSYTTSLGVPEVVFSNMKPAMVLLQIGVLEYISMGYLPEHGVESQLRAKKGERKILALETVEQQLAAATALPLSLQSELLVETLDNIDSTHAEISNLVHAWLAGDEQHLNRLFNDNTKASVATQQWLDDLLNKRNIGMAEGVAELLQSEGTYFVLIGAAHLVGDNSVLALLAQERVTATRLQHSSLDQVAKPER